MNQKNQKNTAKKGVTAKNSAKPEWAPGMPFTFTNYILMIAGVVILLIGYFMLSGGGSDDPSQFSDARNCYPHWHDRAVQLHDPHRLRCRDMAQTWVHHI